MKQFYSTGLRILTWAALFAAVITSSCKKDDTDNNTDNGGGGEPVVTPVTLTDQIEYDGGDPIDIKSAIYEVDEDNSSIYTFYLSPTADIETVNEMKAADDYLKVVVLNPHGTVNTSSENFEVAYEDITVNNQTVKTDVKKIELSANLLEASSTLTLSLDVEMTSGKTLRARYASDCLQYKLPTLNNQYALDDAIAQLGSVVEWADLKEGTTTYYFYKYETQTGESGKDEEVVVTAPSEDKPAVLTIQLSSDINPSLIVNGLLSSGTTGTTATPLEINLASIDASKISIQCGDFKTSAGATGTLSLKKNANNSSQLTVALDVEQNGQRLRANCTNKVITSGYESSNKLTVKFGGETKFEGSIQSLFRYDNVYANSYQFALGVPGAENEETGPAGLTSGSYAVQMDIPNSELDKKLNLADLASVENPGSAPFRFYLYDYLTAKTYDPLDKSGAGATGTISAIRVGSNAYYVKVDVQFPNDGPTVEAEWYGNFTRSQSDLSEVLLPTKAFEPQILIQDPDGNELVKWKINKVMVRHDSKYSIGGGPYIKAYVFYFVNDYSEVDNYESSTTPWLVVADEYLTCDVANMKDEANMQWKFSFSYEKYLKNTEYGSAAPYTARTPDESSLMISKTETEDGPQWKISFKMKDWGILEYGASTGSGTNRNVVIEWEGTLSPYTGSKTNDLDNSFFEE